MLIFASAKAIKSQLNIVVGSSVHNIIGNILFFQLVVVFVVVVWMSFRHKCVFVCDDYIEIKDGLILYRLLYKRKIYYSDIIECRKYNAEDRIYRSRMNIMSIFFHMFLEMQPYGCYEKNYAVVIYRRSFGSFVFSPDDQEGFIEAVNKRLHKSVE